MKINFTHRQFSHCESGVTANLLNHYGFPCSEAMAFGIGSGLFFAYFPFVKLNNLPLAAFRSSPGSIFKKVTKRLGIQVKMQAFRDQRRAERRLDELLESGHPVGVQTGAYWLPYFPPAYRFHFNGHNLVVVGREGDGYRISDPVFEEMVYCSGKDLTKARFSKGALAPKGKIYYITCMSNHQFDLEKAVTKGIEEVYRRMLAPFPLIGVRGIRFLARRIALWPDTLGKKQAILHLGHLIRMQEEIGTGGAGFRFIFAAFLEEAATVLNNSSLKDLSEQCTEIGDQWRNFALNASRTCKDRAVVGGGSFLDLSEQLQACADREKHLFKGLGLALHPTSAC